MSAPIAKPKAKNKQLEYHYDPRNKWYQIEYGHFKRIVPVELAESCPTELLRAVVKVMKDAESL